MDTPQYSLRVQKPASTGNGVQIMLFYTNDNCDGEADVEAIPANEVCININRHQYSYKVSFTRNTPRQVELKKTNKNNGYFEEDVKCD